MSMKVIAYDVGTTGLKACLFTVSRDEGIAYIASTVEDYGLQVLGDGAIEQNPDDWWHAMGSSTRKLLQQTGVNRDEIQGISFCSQMQNVLMVDETGVPLRPCISWMDTRADLQFNRCMNTGLKIEGDESVQDSQVSAHHGCWFVRLERPCLEVSLGARQRAGNFPESL